MGSKCRWFILGFLLFRLSINAQIATDFRTVDSISYNYYLSGKWNDLIAIGSKALKNNIDFKFLRQRLGFAYFSEGNYDEAGKHFEKALSFDGYDSFSLTWNYYSLINSGHMESARLFAGRMPGDLRDKLLINFLVPVESVEAEFCYKYAGTGTRSNPLYYHIGINSMIGYRMNLFQMYSLYTQSYAINKTERTIIAKDRQPEYYALLKYSLSPHIIIKTAYHYLKPAFNSASTTGYLGYVGVAAWTGGFNFEADASVLKTNVTVNQTGISTGYSFPGKPKLYVVSALSMTNNQIVNNFIFNQKAGLALSEKIWVEGNITLGNMTNYHDHDAMYVYNSVDPCKKRAGISMFVYQWKHLSLWTNFSWEQKEFFENSLNHYNQFSYLGGVKWKI